MSTSKTITLDRVRGMLIGVAIGDALGAPHEFRYMKNVYTGYLQYPVQLQFRFGQKYKYPIASYTDDTESTITLARSLVRNKGYDEKDAIMSYLRWVNSDTRFLGTNTRSLFKNIKTIRGYKTRWQKNFSGPPDEWSQSNGSLMRCSPLAVLSDSKHVITDCSISNPHPINIECNMIYVQACRLALQGYTPVDIFNQVASLVKTRPVYDTLQQVINKEKRDITDKKGWVLHALYCTFWCLLYHTRFEDAMEWVITQGGDTDTNGAITAGLLGALLGYDKILTEPKTGHNINLIRNIKPGPGDEVRPKEYTLEDFDTLTQELYQLSSM